MSDESKVRRQILQYLHEQPQASDTLEGVAKWWMMRHQVNESVMLTRQALDYLVAAGCVVERKSRDGRMLYSLPPSN